MFRRNRYNYDEFIRDTVPEHMAEDPLEGAPSPGERAPDIEGRTLDGKKFRLKALRGKRNLVLTFGSATCPQTAVSLAGLNDLYTSKKYADVAFLFVYVREAFPGERIPAHESIERKRRAAAILQDAERSEIPILVDSLHGEIHRQYGELSNATFLIDKSGRVAFRSRVTRPPVIAEALEELLQLQDDLGEDHFVVLNGEDSQPASPYLLLRARRALKRGGERSIASFRREMGLPGQIALAGSHMTDPILNHPVKATFTLLAAMAVIGGGAWAGMALRRRRVGTYHSPYESRGFRGHSRNYDSTGDYEAVGI